MGNLRLKVRKLTMITVTYFYELVILFTHGIGRFGSQPNPFLSNSYLVTGIVGSVGIGVVGVGAGVGVG